METTVATVSRRNLILKWGAIIGVSVYAISLVGRLVGLEGNTMWGIASFIVSTAIVAACMTMAVKTWRDRGLGGYISFNKAFSTSFLTGLVATGIICLLTIIVLQFMGEKFAQEMEDRKMEQVAQLEESGADEETIEMTEKWFDVLTSLPVIIAMIVIMYTIGSVIMALIVGAITKKDNPNVFPG